MVYSNKKKVKDRVRLRRLKGVATANERHIANKDKVKGPHPDRAGLGTNYLRKLGYLNIKPVRGFLDEFEIYCYYQGMKRKAREEGK